MNPQIPRGSLNSWGLVLRPFVLVFVGLTIFHPTALRSQSPPPTITLDLRAFGYMIPVARRDLRAIVFMHDAVAFLDEHTLAVSYFIKNDHPDFARRDGTPSGAVLFHSVFLDLPGGSVSAQRSWSNAGYWNVLLPMDNGSFFVQSNNWIAVYSRNLQCLVRRRLVYPSDLLPRFQVSPSGRTLYGFQDWQDPDRDIGVTKIAVLDPTTLEMDQSQVTPLHIEETVSDLQVVYKAGPDPSRLESYPVASSARKVTVPASHGSKVGRLLRDSHCSAMTFVNNSVLAIGGDCSHLVLLDSDEKLPDGLRADLHFENRTVGGNLHASRQGNRLAFALYDAREKAVEREIEVDVYDLSENRVVFSLEPFPTPRLKLSFALSPDGSQLAVMRDNIVRIWKVPDRH